MAKTTGKITGLLILLLALGLNGCGNRSDSHGHDHSHDGHGHGHQHAAPDTPASPATERRVRTAVAELQPTEGNQARGTVTFTRVDEGILVTVDLQGVPGPGKRGFHIHEHGDCSAPDGTSAGGHFNPKGMPHASPDSPERHAGDFGNLTVDESGRAETQFVDRHIAFEGPTSIIGRAVIVHAQEDDLQSQPTGDAGARVACGVIEAVEFEP